MPSNKTSIVLESIKYIQQGNYFHLSLTIKYLVSETMLPGADTIWYGHKSLWTNASGPSCPSHRGRALQMLSPSHDPGTAGASRRLETLFVKASPAPCKQMGPVVRNVLLDFSHTDGYLFPRGCGVGRGWDPESTTQGLIGKNQPCQNSQGYQWLNCSWLWTSFRSLVDVVDATYFQISPSTRDSSAHLNLVTDGSCEVALMFLKCL